MTSDRQQVGTHIRRHAYADPDHPAIIDALTGRHVSYAELARNSGRAAGMLRALGLGPGRRIALLMANTPEFFEVCWAARQIGADYTPVSVQFRPPEIAAVIDDCEPDVLIAGADQAEVVQEVLPRLRRQPTVLVAGGSSASFEQYEVVRDGSPEDCAIASVPGQDMLYSSGTTGRPTATVREFPPSSSDGLSPAEHAMIEKFALGAKTVHLCTVPLYHALGLRLCLLVQACGGTCVILGKFDPERALSAIEMHRCTHSVWVPTMFVRLLKLPRDKREQ